MREQRPESLSMYLDLSGSPGPLSHLAAALAWKAVPDGAEVPLRWGRGSGTGHSIKSERETDRTGDPEPRTTKGPFSR